MPPGVVHGFHEASNGHSRLIRTPIQLSVDPNQRVDCSAVPEYYGA